MEILRANTVSGLKPHDVYVSHSLDFKGGGYEPKRRITGTVGSTSGRQVQLIERRRTDVEHVVEFWKRCREVELPVVSTLRWIDLNRLLVTDVKADGSQVYGKSTIIMHDFPEDFDECSPHSLDDRFIEIMKGPEVREVIKASESLAELAGTSGVELPDDDAYELIVHPNNTWNLIMLDLSEGVIWDSSYDQKQLKAINHGRVKEFFKYLVGSADYLSSR